MSKPDPDWEKLREIALAAGWSGMGNLLAWIEYHLASADRAAAAPGPEGK